MIEGTNQAQGPQKLRYGMVGGGPGAFIGDVHRKAIAMDGKADLVAGVFSRDFAGTQATGAALGLAADRLYKTYEAMAQAEAARPDGIDFVSIVTPNAVHFPAAKAFLNAGIHVVCDKPLTVEAAEAAELEQLAKAKGLVFCVTYTYTGYPTAKQARAMIKNGDIGDIRFVQAEYVQGWLATKIEDESQKQASWRTNPALSGKSNCVGDIGSHIENMVAYMTGLKIESVCARLDSFVDGRALDDNASIMVNYEGGAKGLYWATQIAVGRDNALKVQVFGTKGSLSWSQENPNYLTVDYIDKPTATFSRGRDAFYPSAQAFSRISSGHPEGYFEAFANLYLSVCNTISKKKNGQQPSAEDLDFPTPADGLDGVKFIGACVESSQKGSTWVRL